MHIVFPVRLDRRVFKRGDLAIPITSVSENDNFDFVDAVGESRCVSGWDSSARNKRRGTRLTNLCGIRGGELMKACPYCHKIKRHSAYGGEGRITDKYRDQSNCEACRPISAEQRRKRRTG